MSTFDGIAGGFDFLVGKMQQLQLQAAQQYEPLVEGLVRTGSSDVQRIEHTLDGLLDFCGHTQCWSYQAPVPPLLSKRGPEALLTVRA